MSTIDRRGVDVESTVPPISSTPIVVVLSNETDITGPNPGYTPASGSLQVLGGVTIYKNLQALGGQFYLGDGTTNTGFSGQLLFNMNGANSGFAGGIAMDFDNAGFQTMTIGNFSAVTNGLISGVYDATPTWKSNNNLGWRFFSHARSADALRVFDRAVGTTLTVYTPGSGTGAGSAVVGQITGGNGTWAIGDQSNILGGSYSAVTTIFSNVGDWNFYSTPLGGRAMRVNGTAIGTTGTLFGPGSGTGAGNAIVGQVTGGNATWALGDASNILGGAYDPTALLYSATAAYRLYGLTAGILQASANGMVSVAAAGQIHGTATNDNAVAGAVGELFNATAPNSSINFTVTIASPAVVTQTAHGYSNTGTAAFVASTTGALPTGLTAGTVYYTIPGTVTASTFELATSIANAFAGTAINTTGTQSGTHTGKSSLPLANATDGTVAAIQLTAGDWDVTGYGLHDAANTTVITQLITNLSLTLASDFVNNSVMKVTFVTTGSQNSLVVPPFRVSVASTQIIYLNANDTFATAALRLSGQLSARRVR